MEARLVTSRTTVSTIWELMVVSLTIPFSLWFCICAEARKTMMEV